MLGEAFVPWDTETIGSKIPERLGEFGNVPESSNRCS